MLIVHSFVHSFIHSFIHLLICFSLTGQVLRAAGAPRRDPHRMTEQLALLSSVVVAQFPEVGSASSMVATTSPPSE